MSSGEEAEAFREALEIQARIVEDQEAGRAAVYPPPDEPDEPAA